MEDSHFSHSEYHMVLETEADSLICQDFKRVLEKKQSYDEDEHQSFVPQRQSFVYQRNKRFVSSETSNNNWSH